MKSKYKCKLFLANLRKTKKRFLCLNSSIVQKNLYIHNGKHYFNLHVKPDLVSMAKKPIPLGLFAMPRKIGVVHSKKKNK